MSKSGTAFDQADTIAYGYNARSELTNAVAAVDSDYRYAYDFDDIGNREISTECGTNSVYTANSLNQYTAVDEFIPQFDDDGNQTLIKTSTGIWSVTYNGENRPILWICTQSNNSNNTNNQTISMSYDRMGRRVTKNAQRFVYDAYLQLSDNIGNTYIWDPTGKVATRPLAWLRGNSVEYYSHDGGKNVNEVIGESGKVIAHYEYAPFGAVARFSGILAVTNPWRFSSEYSDDEIAVVYYNYRYYDSISGRWLTRDPIEEIGALYVMSENNVVTGFDLLGLNNVSMSYENNVAEGTFYQSVISNEGIMRAIEVTFHVKFSCDSDGRAQFEDTFVEFDALGDLDEFKLRASHKVGRHRLGLGLSVSVTMKHRVHITQLAHDNAKKANCKFKRYRIDAWEEFEFQGSATPTLTWLGIGFSVWSWDWSLYKHKKSFYQSVEVEVEACCCGTIPMAESVTSQVVGFPGDSAK